VSWVRPLLAGIGAAPHRRAKAASDLIRSRLSPVVMSTWPATSGPTPRRASKAGATWCTS
jgi:hypothetical protein